MTAELSFSVLSLAQARAALLPTLARFRKEGAAAEPLIFGQRRRPEAVLLAFETFERMVSLLEDHELAAIVRERLAAGPAALLDIAAVAAELGVDLTETTA